MNRPEVLRFFDQASLIALCICAVWFGKAREAGDVVGAVICVAIAVGCGFACEKLNARRDALIRRGAR